MFVPTLSSKRSTGRDSVHRVPTRISRIFRWFRGANGALPRLEKIFDKHRFVLMSKTRTSSIVHIITVKKRRRSMHLRTTTARNGDKKVRTARYFFCSEGAEGLFRRVSALFQPQFRGFLEAFCERFGHNRSAVLRMLQIRVESAYGREVKMPYGTGQSDGNSRTRELCSVQVCPVAFMGTAAS